MLVGVTMEETLFFQVVSSFSTQTKKFANNNQQDVAQRSMYYQPKQ